MSAINDNKNFALKFNELVPLYSACFERAVLTRVRFDINPAPVYTKCVVEADAVRQRRAPPMCL